MIKVRILSVGCLLLIGTVVAPYLRGQTEQLTNNPSDVAKAASAAELNEAYRKLFEQASDERVREMKTNAHDGIAIQAAWEAVRRSIPSDPLADRVPKLSRAGIYRFLGLLVGRLRVSPPQWWEELVTNARGGWTIIEPPPPAKPIATRNAFVVIQQRSGSSFYDHKKCDGKPGGIWAPAHIHLISRDEDFSIASINDETYRVPMPRGHSAWGFNVFPIDERCYLVAVHDNVSGNSDLMCIDRHKERPIWRSKIWGNFPTGAGSGAGYFHWLDFKVDNGSVYVFGAMWDSFYVEGFSLADGTNQFRFSTSYPAEIPPFER